MEGGEGEGEVGVLLELVHEVKKSEAVFAAGEGDGEVIAGGEHVIIIDGLFDFGELGLVVFHDGLL